jgi:hypothetical protein
MEHECIRELAVLERQVHASSTFADTSIYDDVVMILAHYRVALVGGVRSSKHINVSIPSHLVHALDEAADVLGHDRSSVALFSLVVILADLPYIKYPRHRESMNTSIDEFFESVRRRVLFGHKLLELQDEEL